MAEGNPFLLVVPASITPGGGFLRDFHCVKRGIPLHEYQLYAVEQWVVARAKYVPTIVVSTNDPSHKIIVDVWTPRADDPEHKAAIWDKAVAMIRADGARPKQTNLGYVPVVSLLGFRSDLSIVLLPDGDYQAAKEALYTNINLRRLGCGGRSGLTLSEASPSQQERFLQQYRLPSAAASGPNFPLAVIRTIQLVQSALSLFDMGPLSTMFGFRKLNEPDGLLCESTISSIGEWQVEVAYPLLGSELGESILSASVLSALLSIVIAVRCRLLTMGVHHVPSDPFVDRSAFLRCYSMFLKTTRNAPGSEYLAASGIAHLRQQYSRTTKEYLKRAIRHRIDDIRGEVGHNGLSSGVSKSAILEEETTDINTFVAAVQNNGSSDVQSVVYLWKGKFKKDKFAPRRSATWLPGASNQTTGEDAISAGMGESSTESDDEAGFGKLLKGVSKRTKKIGGGVTGLLDKTGVRGNAHGDRDDFPKSRQNGQNYHGMDEEHSSQLQVDDNLDNGLYRVSPFISNASLPSASVTASPGNSYKDFLNVPTEQHSPNARPSLMRRSITDQGASSHPVPPLHLFSPARRRRHSLSCMRALPRTVEIMSIRRMRADVELYMGFAELRNRERHFQQLVRALTEIDKAYEMSLAKLSPAIQKRANEVEQLSERAKKLASQVEGFTSSSSTGRQAPVGTGRSASSSISSDPLKSDHQTIVALAVGTERLSYAQTILEEKVREVEAFQRTLIGKIGGSEVLLDDGLGKGEIRRISKRKDDLGVQQSAQGGIVKGLVSLTDGPGGGRGTRKLLEVIGLWSMWLSYLKGRITRYL